MAELALYEVQHRNFTTTMKLSEEEAESYGDRAKKVGSVKPVEPQPVARPSHAVDPDEDEPAAEEGAKQAPPARNKARSTAKS